LFNFATGLFETVDTGPASFTDELIEFSVTDDPGRFVEAGTGLMRARVIWSGTVFGRIQRWGAYVDRLGWEVIGPN